MSIDITLSSGRVVQKSFEEIVSREPIEWFLQASCQLKFDAAIGYSSFRYLSTWYIDGTMFTYFIGSSNVGITANDGGLYSRCVKIINDDVWTSSLELTIRLGEHLRLRMSAREENGTWAKGDVVPTMMSDILFIWRTAVTKSLLRWLKPQAVNFQWKNFSSEPPLAQLE